MVSVCSTSHKQTTAAALIRSSWVAVALCSSATLTSPVGRSRQYDNMQRHATGGRRSPRRSRQLGSIRSIPEWSSVAALRDEHFPTAAWSMQPATCTRQRLSVVLVSAAFVGGRAVAIGGALASFWRLFLTSPATKHFARNLIRAARPLLSGPFSVIVVAVALIGALIAAVRSRIMAAVRNCKECRGYGIERCPLCGGMGLVGWEGKWNHEEPCPMCLARRYVNCRSCGGLHHRPIFVHIRSKAQKLLEIEVPAAKDLPSTYFARLTAD